jgi:hypothetical protein
MIRRASVGLVLASVIAASASMMEPVVAAERAPPKVIRLEPKKMKDVEVGKGVVVKGAAGPQAHRFGLDKITYLMPVVVALRPVNKGDEVGLKLTKYAWNQPLRNGSTSGDVLSYAFRTEGEFQIAVDSKKPGTPYRLFVWVGDEVKPEFTPVVVKASEFDGPKSSLPGGVVLWVIAGALVAIVALLAVLVLRRKAS